MDNEIVSKHTALIEREEALLGQIDTCQQLLAATCGGFFIRPTKRSTYRLSGV